MASSVEPSAATRTTARPAGVSSAVDEAEESAPGLAVVLVAADGSTEVAAGRL